MRVFLGFLSFLWIVMIGIAGAVAVEFPLVGPDGQLIYGLSHFNRMALTSDDQALITSTDLGFFEWELNQGELIGIHLEYNEPRISPDGQMVAAIERGGIRIYQRTGLGLGEEHVYHEQDYGNSVIAIAPNNACLATLTADEAVRIWTSEMVELSLEETVTGVQQVFFSPQSHYVVVLANEPRDESSDSFMTATEVMYLFAVDTGKLIVRYELSQTGSFMESSKVVFSADETHFATAGTFHTLKLWDNLGEMLHDFDTIQLRVYQLCSLGFSGDGNFLYCVSQDQGLVLDLVDYSVRTRIAREDGKRVYSSVVCRDGETVALAVQDNIQFCDLVSGETISSVTVENFGGMSYLNDQNKSELLLSSDHRFLMVNYYGDLIDGVKLGLFDLEKQQIACSIYGHSNFAISAQFAYDGSFLLDVDLNFYEYDVTGQNLLKKIPVTGINYNSYVEDMALASTQNRAVLIADLSSTESIMQTWDLSSGTLLNSKSFTLDGLYLIDLALNAMGNVAMVQFEEELYVLNTETGDELAKLTAEDLGDMNIAADLSPNAPLLYYVHNDILYALNYENGQTQTVFSLPFNESKYARLKISPNENYLMLIGGEMKQAALIDLKTGAVIQSYESIPGMNNSLVEAKFTPDEKYVFLDGRPISFLIDAKRGTIVKTLSSRFCGVEFLFSGDQAIFVNKAGHRIVWNLRDLLSEAVSWDLYR